MILMADEDVCKKLTHVARPHDVGHPQAVQPTRCQHLASWIWERGRRPALMAPPLHPQGRSPPGTSPCPCRRRPAASLSLGLLLLSARPAHVAGLQVDETEGPSGARQITSSKRAARLCLERPSVRHPAATTPVTPLASCIFLFQQ